MGGHVGGAQASSLAVRTVYESLMKMEIDNIPKALEEALQTTNQTIYEAARKNHRLMGMGTTIVAAAITDSTAHFAHVGDSRAYLVREGSVQQITRDHTMVNLFVDAELLTPEDAATHPEAHVLSRSLGVERQVDVEISDPLTMQPDDVVFLCSDGVHGVVTDWEIANVDWGAPNEGIQHVIDIVAAREGDDNATCVAVLLATSFEDVPPTPVPEVKKIDDGAPKPTSQGVTAVPIDDPNMGSTLIPEPLHSPASPPAQQSQERQKMNPDGTPSYIVYEEPSAAAEEPQPLDLRKRKQAEEKEKQAAGAEKKRGLASLLLLGGVAMVAGFLLLLVLGGTGLLITGGGLTAVDDSERMAENQIPGPDNDANPIGDPTPEDPAIPSDDDDDTEEPVEVEPPEEVERPIFAPELPPAPRRLPHRSSRFTQPPPGGPLQWEAVQAARNHQCREAIDSVAEGMRMSVDHATLYSQAWFCFNETHQRPLAERTVTDWQDFVFLIPHFEGPPEDREDIEDEKIKALPIWYQPSVNGIEYRLEAWAHSDNKDKMQEVLVDLLGEPTVADHLAKDMMMEAIAAEGLSRVESKDPRVIAWWARRVYVVAYGMEGRVGRLLEAHRPELVPEIRELLAKATTAPELTEEEIEAGVEPREIPEVITQALEVAIGLQPPPDAIKKVTTHRPQPILEPTDDDLRDDEKPIIHKR